MLRAGDDVGGEAKTGEHRLSESLEPAPHSAGVSPQLGNLFPQLGRDESEQGDGSPQLGTSKATREEPLPNWGEVKATRERALPTGGTSKASRESPLPTGMRASPIG